MGYRHKAVYIPALFYADYGLIMTNDRKEMEKKDGVADTKS